MERQAPLPPLQGGTRQGPKGHARRSARQGAADRPCTVGAPCVRWDDVRRDGARSEADAREDFVTEGADKGTTGGGDTAHDPPGDLPTAR